MRRTVLLGTTLAIALAGTACQDPVSEPTASPSPLGPQLAQSDAPALDRAAVRLPESGRITDQYIVDIAGRAIDPNDYVCPPSTEVIDFYLAAAYDIIDNEPALFDIIYNVTLADLIPTYYTLYFATDEEEQYFGYDGEFTQVLQKTHRDAARFWDIDPSQIQLLGMHGSMLLDLEKSARTYEFLFGLSPASAMFYATLARDALLASETMNGGDHPLFSFNAFAFSSRFFGQKIVMGDGMLAAYDALGFGDVAPQAIYMHEFAHHIQFQNGYFDDPYAHAPEPESTRYTELMADAFSAYYLTHARGGTLRQRRVSQFLEAFYQIGDCGFTSDGHHGTPAQRMRAAQFGFDVASQAQKQGHILSSEAFHDLFVAAYPDLIAPDAI